MKRYWMGASNGSVVPHEADNGEWVKWEDIQVSDDAYDGWVVCLNDATDRVERYRAELERLMDLVCGEDQEIIAEVLMK